MPVIKSGPDKGKKISWKEFFKRWGEGIRSVSPLNLAIIERNGIYITLAGIICGLVISVITFKTLWWLGIILLGSMIITLTSLISCLKKVSAYRNVEAILHQKEVLHG